MWLIYLKSLKFSFRQYYLIYGIIFLFGCHSDKNEADSKLDPPNIVWLVCEDQSPDFFPMYGDSTVHLPELEKLAEQSIVFQNAYSPVPVCAPARSSIITGMYPTTLGTHNMRCYNAYNPKNESDINIPSYSPIVPGGVKPFTLYLRQAGYYCTNNAKEDYNFAPMSATWDESSENATWKNREPGQPFFSVFNFEVTHESRIWMNGNKKLLVDPETIHVPPYFPDDSLTRHDLAVNYSNLVRLDSAVGKIIKQLKDDNLYDNTIIFFYSDHGGPFPRHKRALYETGTKVPLFVKMPGQQESKINHDLISFIDFAPTVLSLANIAPPEYIQGVAFLGDFVPDEKREFLVSTSDRFDERYDRIRAIRAGKYKYLRNYYPKTPYALDISYRRNMPLMNHLIELSDQDKLDRVQRLWMADSKPTEELYDLENDPLELDNLVDDADYTEVLNELKSKLNDWIVHTSDLGEYNEGELIDNWLIGGKQPQLPSPQLEMLNGEYLSLTNPVTDATIIWKKIENGDWNIYSEPIRIVENMKLTIKAERIGYLESDKVTFEN